LTTSVLAAGGPDVVVATGAVDVWELVVELMDGLGADAEEGEVK